MTSHLTLSYFNRPTRRFPIPTLDSIFANLAHRAEERFAPAMKQQTYYQLYFLLGKYFAPRRTLEIGTLFGYGGIALVKGANCLFFKSIDSQSYENPFGIPTQQVARENFAGCCPQTQTEFVIGNSHRIALRSEEIFDLIHVDGDHSTAGCRDDILKYWPHLVPDGVMLVDDICQGSVRQGYAEALARLGAPSAFFPTNHGCAMLWKGGQHGAH